MTEVIASLGAAAARTLASATAEAAASAFTVAHFRDSGLAAWAIGTIPSVPPRPRKPAPPSEST